MLVHGLSQRLACEKYMARAEQDFGGCGAAGVSTEGGSVPAGVGSGVAGHSGDPGSGPEGSQEAAAYGEANLRAAECPSRLQPRPQPLDVGACSGSCRNIQKQKGHHTAPSCNSTSYNSCLPLWGRSHRRLGIRCSDRRENRSRCLYGLCGTHLVADGSELQTVTGSERLLV